MSETLTTPTAPTTEAAPLPDDLLSRIVAETERQVTARVNRPSPIKLRTLDEVERFADIAARSSAVPNDYRGKPDSITVAIQMGSELGLAPMQSLQNIAVINGRPSVWGDAMPGLCRASGLMSYMREWSEGQGETLTWYCETRRRDDPNIVRRSFSVADATTAGLWNKASTPWKSHPGRMLQMRARGFCLRDAFPDVLRGLISAEEAADIPFEATGLQMPPQAAQKPPQTAAAATTQRPPRVVDKTAYDTSWLAPLEEPDGPTWLKNLELVMANCTTQDEVTEAAGHSSVRNATRLAPPDVRRRISELLAEHFKRLAPEEQTAETDKPPEDPFDAAKNLAGEAAA